MANGGTSLCYFVIVIIAIGFLLWGFMDLLKKQQPTESDTSDVISRQIRGFAFIMMSQVVLVVGGMICFGMSGGLDQLGKAVSKLSR